MDRPQSEAEAEARAHIEKIREEKGLYADLEAALDL